MLSQMFTISTAELKTRAARILNLTKIVGVKWNKIIIIIYNFDIKNYFPSHETSNIASHFDGWNENL